MQSKSRTFFGFSTFTRLQFIARVMEICVVYTENFLMNQLMKEFWKSVYTCQSGIRLLRHSVHVQKTNTIQVTCGIPFVDYSLIQSKQLTTMCKMDILWWQHAYSNLWKQTELWQYDYEPQKYGSGWLENACILHKHVVWRQVAVTWTYDVNEP